MHDNLDILYYFYNTLKNTIILEYKNQLVLSK